MQLYFVSKASGKTSHQGYKCWWLCDEVKLNPSLDPGLLSHPHPSGAKRGKLHSYHNQTHILLAKFCHSTVSLSNVHCVTRGNWHETSTLALYKFTHKLEEPEPRAGRCVHWHGSPRRMCLLNDVVISVATLNRRLSHTLTNSTEGSRVR